VAAALVLPHPQLQLRLPRSFGGQCSIELELRHLAQGAPFPSSGICRKSVALDGRLLHRPRHPQHQQRGGEHNLAFLPQLPHHLRQPVAAHRRARVGLMSFGGGCARLRTCLAMA